VQPSGAGSSPPPLRSSPPSTAVGRTIRRKSCAYHGLDADGREPALVGGLRKGRKAKGLHKSASRFAKWIRDRGCPDTRCGLKVYRREDHLTLPHFSMHRYLPALFLIYGHEIAYEPVNDRLQLKGASKYTNPGRALIGLYNLGPARRPPASQVKVGRRRNDVGTIRDLVGVDELVWITVGFIAQFMFSMRFIVSGSRPRRDGQALFRRRSGYQSVRRPLAPGLHG